MVDQLSVFLVVENLYSGEKKNRPNYIYHSQSVSSTPLK